LHYSDPCRSNSFARSVAVDDYLFIVGGKPAIFGSGTAAVLSARIGQDGRLAAWTAQAVLTAA